MNTLGAAIGTVPVLLVQTGVAKKVAEMIKVWIKNKQH